MQPFSFSFLCQKGKALEILLCSKAPTFGSRIYFCFSNSTTYTRTDSETGQWHTSLSFLPNPRRKEKKKKVSFCIYMNFFLGLENRHLVHTILTVLVKQNIYINIYLNLGTSSMNETGLTFPEKLSNLSNIQTNGNAWTFTGRDLKISLFFLVTYDRLRNIKISDVVWMALLVFRFSLFFLFFAANRGKLNLKAAMFWGCKWMKLFMNSYYLTLRTNLFILFIWGMSQT